MGSLPAPQMGPYFVVFDGLGNPTLVQVTPGGGLIPVPGGLNIAGVPVAGSAGTLVGGAGGQLVPSVGGAPVDATSPSSLQGASPGGGLGSEVTDNAGSGGPGLDTPGAVGLDSLANLYDQTLTYGGGLTSPGGQNGQVTNNLVKTFQRKPWLDPPEGSKSFDANGAGTIAGVGVGAVLVTHTVPVGFDGVLTAYSWTYIPSSGVGDSFTDGSGNIIVNMTKAATPVPNYTNITIQKGCIGVARPISPIRLYSGQTIALSYVHVSNASLLGVVVGTLEGYDYPQQ